MSPSTTRATILPTIIRMISEDRNITEKEAMDLFYSSATGSSFADNETGLYGQSPLYVFSLFQQEMRENK